MKKKTLYLLFCSLLYSMTPQAQAQLIWAVGRDDNGWPAGDGGGPDASFVQEAGVNAPPGNPESPEENQQADDDYYFAGLYDNLITGNGDYVPVGLVVNNEEAAERAFADTDNLKRYHFNLPETMKPTDLLSVTFDAVNLHTDGQADPRYGVEVYVNGVLVQPEIVIRPAQLDVDYTTAQFSLSSVNAQVGPGFDNVVSLKGINYNSEGGGNWMGIDYVQLNQEEVAIPAPKLPLAAGKDDNGHPAGDGGGENASFVQENGTINPLPGSPTSPEVNQQADNDYYWAGLYTKVIPTNGEYEPVGPVPVNEEAAERAFAGDDRELRYHFNIPNTVLPNDQLAVSFQALDLHTDGQSNPRWGVEVWVNNVRVQPEILVTPADLNKTFTTPGFTLSSVGAQVGPGFDNIVTLKGVSYNNDGGGNWMGIDFVQINPVARPIPPAVLPFAIGMNDNAWPVDRNGGGGNAAFVQENGVLNPLPGTPTSPKVDQQADNDYYLAGIYSTVITGNGTYTPVGEVPAHEEAAERAFAGGDTELRYHFNLPPTLGANDQLSVSFDAMNLELEGIEDPRWGVEVYVNNVKVLDEVVIRPDQLGTMISTPAFTLASVNAQAGPGFDNILTLKGISYAGEGGGNWMGIDFVQMNPVLPAPFPWDVGRDDDAHPVGNGGGLNATFVQEAGVNPLPGNPANPEVNQQSDDDYYFAGEYTKVIPGVTEFYGEYEPIGTVLVNEESAERAFAGADNDLRYHFNLPATLKPTDQLIVTYDMLSLDTSGGDPQYGVEVYVNGVLVQPEILIRPENFGTDYSTEPFTLASVGAEVGPGWDNIVHLKGINHSGDGGGQWMGIDYVQLSPMPTPTFPIQIGKDDNDWPVGDGGGENATFVQEAGANPLPGNAKNLELAGRGDDDYYLAGIYTNAIASVVELYGEYTPIGIVPRNEESAERAFAGTDNEKRFHFNLPTTLQASDKVTVTFDPFNLDTDGIEDPRYGVEVYFNGVLVGAEKIVRPADIDTDITTAEFTLGSVNAAFGLGNDNVVTLKGVNYSAEGGGNWMGIDYVSIQTATADQLQLLKPTISNGKITLDWTGGAANLQWAPSITGPWTTITAPAKPYTEDVVLNQNRFYRLIKP